MKRLEFYKAKIQRKAKRKFRKLEAKKGQKKRKKRSKNKISLNQKQLDKVKEMTSMTYIEWRRNQVVIHNLCIPKLIYTWKIMTRLLNKFKK